MMKFDNSEKLKKNEKNPSWRALSPYIYYQLFLTSNSVFGKETASYLKIKTHENIKLSRIKLSITSFSSSFEDGDKCQEVIELYQVHQHPFVVNLPRIAAIQQISPPHDNLIIEIHELYNAAEPNTNLITSEIKEETTFLYNDIS